MIRQARASREATESSRVSGAVFVVYPFALRKFGEMCANAVA